MGPDDKSLMSKMAPLNLDKNTTQDISMTHI